MGRAIGIGQIYEILGATGTGQYQTVFGPGDSPNMWRMIVDCQLAGDANINYYLQAGLWVLHQDSDIRYAHMSKQYAAIHGSWAMVGINGNVVRVTSVGVRLASQQRQWPDTVYVGEVFDYTYHDKINGTPSCASANVLGMVQPWHGVSWNGQTISTAKKPTSRNLQIGDTCPVCQKEWKQRELATSVYVGCWCP